MAGRPLKPPPGGGGTVTHDPILFVHGWNSSGSVWNTMGGAANTQTACIGQSALYSDATVYGQVREFVR